MSTSDRLAFNLLSLAPPWRIERPARIRPQLGPERDAWLEQRLLYRSARSLKAVLDRIDPAIANNAPVAEIDEDAVTIALLDFLDPTPSEDAADIDKGRMPVHKAQAFLSYFVRGFQRYCHLHNLRQPRLPLSQEFSLTEGSLQAGTFSDLREYRRCLKRLSDEIKRTVIETEAFNMPPNTAAALVLCSSALFGGLARKEYWDAFVTALTSPIQRCGELYVFRFDLRSTYRWIADPVTEGVLRRFVEYGFLPFPENTRVSPGLVRRTLSLDAASDSSLAHLERLVRAAHIRYFGPDVAAVAQGHIPNTPLADEPWLRLMSGKRHPAPRATIPLSIPKITPPTQAGTIQQLALQEIIEEISFAIRWDPKQLRRKGAPAAREDQGIRSYLSKAKTALRTTEGQLEQLYIKAGDTEGHHRCFAHGLLCYARDLLELGGLKVRNLAPGTISNYIGIIRKQLAPLYFSDFVALGTEARADAYRNVLRRQLASDQATHRTAIEGFERSLLRHIDLIDEVDWSTIPGRAVKRHLPSVDANFIDIALYRHIFESLEKSAHNSYIINFARALLVILYRFGLRTGEAAEVTAGAITLRATGYATLRVTASAITSRKSKNALRLIGPIKLPQDELKFLAEYLDLHARKAAQRSRDRAGEYLFASGATNKLEHVEVAQRLLIEALRSASGDPLLRPRHLRHTFVSNLFLEGRAPLGYGDPTTPERAGDVWWRTFAAGHASPETGLVSYIHVTELAHYHYCCQLVAKEADLSFLSLLAGNNPRSLERRQQRGATVLTAAITFYQDSLRRNFPAKAIRDVLAGRMRYQPIELQCASADVSENVHQLEMHHAWDVYANARVRQTTSDSSEHAQMIRERVRHLEINGHLTRRIQRRPRLSPEETSVAINLWQKLPADEQLRNLVSSAALWLRAKKGQILMPGQIVRDLEHQLKLSGLKGMQSRPATAGKRWLSRQDQRSGNISTAWTELLAFLYSGFG